MQDQGYVDEPSTPRPRATPIKTVGLKTAPPPRALLRRVDQGAAHREVRAATRCTAAGLRVNTTLDLKAQKAAEKAIADSAQQEGRPFGGARRDRARAPARSSRWSAAATSRRSSTTSRCRGAGSRARRSSRSCSRPRSPNGVEPRADLTSRPDQASGRRPDLERDRSIGGDGTMRLRKATEKSVNSVFAQLIMKFGAEKVVDDRGGHGHARRRSNPVPAIALGGLRRASPRSRWRRLRDARRRTGPRRTYGIARGERRPDGRGARRGEAQDGRRRSTRRSRT